MWDLKEFAYRVNEVSLRECVRKEAGGEVESPAKKKNGDECSREPGE